MNKRDSLDSIRRVLVTRLRWLGDVVMSTPMLEALRESLPQASIEYLTYTSFAPVLKSHPAVDRIHTLPPAAGIRATLLAVRSLQRPRIDWCFDTFGNPRSAILVALARPRHSVAQARGIRSFLYKYRLRHPRHERSAVRQHLNLLTPLLGRVETRPTSLFVEEGEREAVARLLKLEPGDNLLLIHPGAREPHRAWPLDRWPELVAEIQELNPDLKVGVVNQPGSETAVQSVVAGIGGNVRQLPVLDLRSLMALLTFTSLYIGNDGGILHCAVALRVPTVAVFGSTAEDTWFPYTGWGPFRVIRRPGEPVQIRGRLRRLPDASVDEVMAAVHDVLRWSGPAKDGRLRAPARPEE